MTGIRSQPSGKPDSRWFVRKTFVMLIIFKTSLLYSCILLFLFTGTKAAGQQYRIVYNVLEDREKGNYEIYSMKMDGTDKRNITNSPGVEWVYYAYRDKLYYVSDQDTCHRCYFLYEMDAAGNNKRKVSDLQLEDSWMGSYGSEMIVAGRIGKVRHQLFTINIFTGEHKQLTNDTNSYNADPIFLYGGNDIAFRHRPDNRLRKTVPAEIWLMNRYGHFKRQFTHYPKEDTTAAWFDYHAGPPQWNSKKRFISYLSKQKGQTQIYAIKEGGGMSWQITTGTLSSGWHSWSSDGKWLAMDKSTNEGKQFDIWLMNYKTKKEIRLTDSDKTEQAPVIVETRQ